MENIYINNLFPNYDKTILKEFDKIEKILAKKNFLHYSNNILMIMFTKISKLYYSDENNKASHMHIGLDSILIFIFNELLNLPPKKFTKFLKQNKLVTKDFLRVNTNENNYKHFSIEMSPDMANKFVEYNNVETTIQYGNNNYYKIKCKSEQILNFKCINSGIILGNFKSYDNYICNEIPFLFLKKPIIYVPEYYDKNLKIWIIELNDNKHLMVVEWPNHKYCPMDHIFKLLLTNNLSNLIHNSKLEDRIEYFTLPLLNNINSVFFNMHEFLEDTTEFEDLFKEKKYHCKNFQFENVSKLKIDDNNMNSVLQDRYFNKNKNDYPYYISINEPFMYLLVNDNQIFQSGGFFDCDFIIFNESYKNEKERIKYQRF